MDFLGMMKKAEELKAKMAEMQAALSDMTIMGSSGGGLVRVTLNGKGDMRGVAIDPSLFTEHDVSVLEDLIMAAHAEAKAKVEYEAGLKMQEATAGLPLPPGMKLPF
jgi:DNA-binding YbaB/EbfC family protein